MIWLTWRQHRRSALFTGVGLLVLAAVMIPTGLAMRHTLANDGLTSCIAKYTETNLKTPLPASCNTALNQFTAHYKAMPFIGLLFVFLPVVMGLFWGAPLVARELEQGTHRLVWTQGVSRRRWVLVKFGLVGVATLVAATVYGLGIAWWWSPLSQVGAAPRLTLFAFDIQGIAPIGYTLFAVALGILAGTIWHKVLPAMAVSLVAYIAVRVPVAALARAHFLTPKVFTLPVLNAGAGPNPLTADWVLDRGIRNADGSLVSSDSWIACGAGKGRNGQVCGHELGLKAGAYDWMKYQPASRFWALQSIEAGLFVAIAVALLYVALRRVRRLA
jgi:ABC-type transport system involved in multi-copper enzyme maturation permease subunit